MREVQGEGAGDLHHRAVCQERRLGLQADLGLRKHAEPGQLAALRQGGGSPLPQRARAKDAAQRKQRRDAAEEQEKAQDQQVARLNRSAHNSVRANMLFRYMKILHRAVLGR